ncbi:MAG: DUF975 family protein [Clostridia bacterium]|nr:DUF975 family protein [Clostridia bacterium]
MINRKQIRGTARRQVRKHYVFLVFLCAILIFLGTEYQTITSGAQLLYNILEGRNTVISVEGDLGNGRITPIGKMYDELIRDRVNAGLEESARRLRQVREATNLDSALGRQRGLLAAIINQVESGQTYVMIQLALHQLLHSEHIASLLLIISSILIRFAIFIFLSNMFSAIVRRALLELRTYRVCPITHLLFFYQVRRWTRVSLTLFVRSLFSFLWTLTLVGGVIKHYSYLMVPYIAAENPDISPLEAIRLSRRMMNGHKWECFLLDLSFTGWHLLGFITFGFADILWVTPYHLSTFTEVYVRLREAAIRNQIPGAEVLNDMLLYTPARRSVLEPAYPELVRYGEYIEEDIVALTPMQAFFARHFGIWIGSLDDKAIYGRQQELRQHTRIISLELNGDAYPQRMHPLFNAHKFHLTRRISFMPPCTIWSLAIIFFFFCFIGWVWEVTHHMITSGNFVNRGARHGPWLPIYGTGVLLITVLLYPLRKKPAAEALGIILLCGLVEYMTSFAMEMAYGKRWWDYTGYFLNLNGRICGEGLFAFCFGGMIAVYLLVPILDALVIRLKPKVIISLSLILLILFATDIVYSHYVPNVGLGITEEIDLPSP